LLVICLLVTCLLVSGCKWDVGQFIAHPLVERRVHESLSGELPAPKSPTVNPDSFRFAMFGDPQIGTDGLSYLPDFRRDIVPRGIEFFCALGDLTNDANATERQQVLAQFDSTGIPFYCTIGNHDLYHADGWDWFKTTFGPSCYTLTVAGRLKFVFLDTAEGTLGHEQFDWLERELADSPGLRTIVATHYPLYDGSKPIMWRISSSEESYKMLSLFARYDVRCFVAGHIHGWRYLRIDGLNHFVCSLPTGTMDYGKPGYLVFTWAHDSLTWEHIEFDGPPSQP
jgi:3',5'-cyclic AMP phosphodiesterase CpdA